MEVTQHEHKRFVIVSPLSRTAYTQRFHPCSPVLDSRGWMPHRVQRLWGWIIAIRLTWPSGFSGIHIWFFHTKNSLISSLEKEFEFWELIWNSFSTLFPLFRNPSPFFYIFSVVPLWRGVFFREEENFKSKFLKEVLKKEQIIFFSFDRYSWRFLTERK